MQTESCLKRRHIGADEDSLQSALRTSLAEATKDADLTSRARELSAAVFAKNSAAERFSVAAVSLCTQRLADSPTVELREALAEAEAAVGFARRARIDASEALLQRFAAEASSARAISAVSALAKNIGVSAGGEVEIMAVFPVRKTASILSLPDTVVEDLFKYIELSSGSPATIFPESSGVRHFAFTCSRFAKLYREKYVKELVFHPELRIAEQERIYAEAVRGAFVRFSAVQSVFVVNSHCVGEKLLRAIRKGSEGISQAAVSEMEASEFQRAVGARSLLTSAIFNDTCSASKVTLLRFYLDTNTPAPSVPGVRSLWNWTAEDEHWLSFLPSFASVAFADLASLCQAPRLCGPRRASLKNLTVGMSAYFLHVEDGYDAEDMVILPEDYLQTLVGKVMERLADFCGLETLLLTNVICRNSFARGVVNIDRLMDTLPNLLFLGIESWQWCHDEGPLLTLPTSVPTELINRNLSLTISVWRETYQEYTSSFGATDVDEVDPDCFRNFCSLIFGELCSHMEVSELLGETIFEASRSEDDENCFINIGVKYHRAEQGI